MEHTCSRHSEILFGNFGLPFKKSRFPEKISHRGDKINLSVYILSEISGFFGKMVNMLCQEPITLTSVGRLPPF